MNVALRAEQEIDEVYAQITLIPEQDGTFAPKSYYSIDRGFKNEAVDRTHLAEFHQIEGLICDRGRTLGHLIGVLHDFFSRLGMSKLKEDDC